MINQIQTDVNRTLDIVRNAPNTELLNSLLAQIGQLRAIVNALSEQIAEGNVNNSDNSDTDGNTNGFVPWANAETVMINNTGVDVPDAALVAEDLTVLNAFKYTTTKNDETIIGVVTNEEIPAGTIGSSTPTGIVAGGQGIVAHHGRVDVLVDAGYGAINVGDKLVASVRAGYAQVADHEQNPGIFGTAREQLLSGASAIEAFVEPPRRNTNAFTAIQNEFDKITYDTDGAITGISGLITDINTYRSADMATLISKQHFEYNASGLIVSSWFSNYAVDGTNEGLVTRSLTYTGRLIDQIIQEVST